CRLEKNTDSRVFRFLWLFHTGVGVGAHRLAYSPARHIGYRQDTVGSPSQFLGVTMWSRIFPAGCPDRRPGPTTRYALVPAGPSDPVRVRDPDPQPAIAESTRGVRVRGELLLCRSRPFPPGRPGQRPGPTTGAFAGTALASLELCPQQADHIIRGHNPD